MKSLLKVKVGLALSLLMCCFSQMFGTSAQIIAKNVFKKHGISKQAFFVVTPEFIEKYYTFPRLEEEEEEEEVNIQQVKSHLFKLMRRALIEKPAQIRKLPKNLPQMLLLQMQLRNKETVTSSGVLKGYFMKKAIPEMFDKYLEDVQNGYTYDPFEIIDVPLMEDFGVEIGKKKASEKFQEALTVYISKNLETVRRSDERVKKVIQEVFPEMLSCQLHLMKEETVTSKGVLKGHFVKQAVPKMVMAYLKDVQNGYTYDLLETVDVPLMEDFKVEKSKGDTATGLRNVLSDVIINKWPLDLKLASKLKLPYDIKREMIKRIKKNDKLALENKKKLFNSMLTCKEQNIYFFKDGELLSFDVKDQNLGYSRIFMLGVDYGHSIEIRCSNFQETCNGISIWLSINDFSNFKTGSKIFQDFSKDQSADMEKFLKEKYPSIRFDIIANDKFDIRIGSFESLNVDPTTKIKLLKILKEKTPAEPLDDDDWEWEEEEEEERREGYDYEGAVFEDDEGYGKHLPWFGKDGKMVKLPGRLDGPHFFNNFDFPSPKHIYLQLNRKTFGANDFRKYDLPLPMLYRYGRPGNDEADQYPYIIIHAAYDSLNVPEKVKSAVGKKNLASTPFYIMVYDITDAKALKGKLPHEVILNWFPHLWSFKKMPKDKNSKVNVQGGIFEPYGIATVTAAINKLSRFGISHHDKFYLSGNVFRFKLIKAQENDVNSLFSRGWFVNKLASGKSVVVYAIIYKNFSSVDKKPARQGKNYPYATSLPRTICIDYQLRDTKNIYQLFKNIKQESVKKTPKFMRL